MSSIENNDDVFAKRLKKEREVRELTQAELARLSGLQTSAIGHFEGNRRKPSFANIRALAKVLRVSADYLTGISDTRVMTAFRNEENLTESDRTTIQMMIDAMNEKNKKA